MATKFRIRQTLLGRFSKGCKKCATNPASMHRHWKQNYRESAFWYWKSPNFRSIGGAAPVQTLREGHAKPCRIGSSRPAARQRERQASRRAPFCSALTGAAAPIIISLLQYPDSVEALGKHHRTRLPEPTARQDLEGDRKPERRAFRNPVRRLPAGATQGWRVSIHA